MHRIHITDDNYKTEKTEGQNICDEIMKNIENVEKTKPQKIGSVQLCVQTSDPVATTSLHNVKAIDADYNVVDMPHKDNEIRKNIEMESQAREVFIKNNTEVHSDKEIYTSTMLNSTRDNTEGEIIRAENTVVSENRDESNDSNNVLEKNGLKESSMKTSNRDGTEQPRKSQPKSDDLEQSTKKQSAFQQ